MALNNNPKPAISILLLLSLLLCLSSVSSSLPVVSESKTVYELLTEFGFPRGLLPDTVKSYSFNDDNWENFEVELSNTCIVNFSGSAYVQYIPKITGHLQYRSLWLTIGIFIMGDQFNFQWIDEIAVGPPPSDSIYFRIMGSDIKKVAVDLFKTVPHCLEEVLANEILQLNSSAPVDNDDDIPKLATE